MGMFPCWKSHIFPQTAWRFDKICVYVSDLRINSRTGKDVWTWWAIILHQDSHQLFTLIKDFPTYSSPFPQQLLPEGLRKFCSSAVTFIRSGSGKIQLPWYQGIQYQPLSIPNIAWLLNCYNQRVSARIFLLDDGAPRHRRIVRFEFLRTGCRSFLWNLCEELVAKPMPKRNIFMRATLVAEVTSTLLFIQVGLFSQGLGQISQKLLNTTGLPFIFWESPNSMEKYQHVSAFFLLP